MNQLKKRRNSQLLLLSFFLLLANSCSGQNTNCDDAKKHLNNGLTLLRSYSATMDTSKLKEALTEADQSLTCTDTRDKAIDLKIIIIGWLKHYKMGYEYIASLKKTEYNYKFKKEMNYDYFRALDYGSRSDTVNKHIYYRKALDAIQYYIDKEKSPVVDKEAYYDLFLTMRLSGDIILMKQKLDILKRSYPGEADFWTGLEDTFVFEHRKSEESTPAPKKP